MKKTLLYNSNVNCGRRMVVLGCSLFLSFALWAQDEDLSTEMILVKPYEPSVSDVQKLFRAPDFADTLVLRPDFEYQFEQHPYADELKPLVSTPLFPDSSDTIDLYRGYLSEGFGNYKTKEIAVGYHTLANDKYLIGGDFSHYSVRGRTRLLSGKRAFSRTSDNALKLYGSWFTPTLTWDAQLDLLRKVTHSYGYNYTIAPDTFLFSDSIRNRFLLGDMKVKMHSNTDGTDMPYYGAEVAYEGIKDKKDFCENRLRASGFWNYGDIEASAGFDVIQRSSFDTLAHVLSIGVQPFYMLHLFDMFDLKVGVPMYFVKEKGISLKWRFFPSAEISYLTIDWMRPFAGLRGGMDLRTYHDLLQENPFMASGEMVTHRYTPWDLYVGTRGRVARKADFTLSASYALIRNEYFFVNRDDGLENYFDLISDDMYRLTLSGAFQYQIIPQLGLNAGFSFYSYDPEHLSKAYHKPSYEWSALLQYDINARLSLHVETIGMGKRYGRSNQIGTPDRKLEGILDFNASLTYKMLHHSYLYVKVNNITSNQYERWMFYPTQKLNFIIGTHYYFK